MRPYTIVAPPVCGSSGVRALYVLADKLRRRGCEVTVRDHQHAVDHGLTDDGTIHILPETGDVYARDFPVVWWMLNRSGRFGTPEVRPEDQVYNWHPCMGGDYPRLTVNTIDRMIFRPKTEADRDGTYWGKMAFYAGKVKSRAYTALMPNRALLDGQDAIYISWCWPADRKSLANLLREVRMVISFDPFTMLIVEAALCGTPVLCIPNDPDCTQAQLDHTASIPGVFWIPEQMPKATADLEHVQAWHDGQMRTWDKSFEAFLTETQKWGAYR